MRRVDPFIVAILLAFAVGLFWPAPDGVRDGIAVTGDILVAILFFLYGLRLRTSEVLDGLTNLKVQGLIFVSTYVVFPIVGLALHPVLTPVLGDGFANGFLYLAFLPSTIQSSVTFTSIARGDTAAAVCAATFSNILGMFLTPLYVLVFMNIDGASAGSLTTVLTQLLLPFIIGQILQVWFGDWIRRYPKPLKIYDQGTVVVIVLAAVLDSTAANTWDGVTILQITIIILLSCVLLAGILSFTWYSGAWFKVKRAGRIAILMCGSKKSLATGLPMAQAIFPASLIGPIAVPVIIFHQIQLLVCAIIASRLGREDTLAE
ncbi:bile acid:sodium symporter family protein [Flaviflexus massiliensis]|uniref:bile acid:sodium symporter family protein n=1 Tax=Flaviflexus massiliensis TaxID=1522309 RepID=UPI0006D53410|nr:bile acid:sodium symporter family protein [Flaviflexus massiliensis]